MVYGPYFPATEKPDLLHRCKSLRFNTKPHSRGANSYALKKIRSTSKVIKTPNGCILTQTNKPIQRDHIEGYCHMCDTCYTRNFIHHYICAYCAVGTCIDCYESLNDTLSGCHSNPVFSEKEHFRSEFVLFSKLSERSIFHLIESTAMEIDVICITKTRMMKVMACQLHLPLPTLQVNYCVGMIF